MFKVEQLPLWDALKTADDAQRARVRTLIEDAAAILDRVIETFPTYTLHNSIHAKNVVQLMADLLGDRRADLTPLEAALLMLSAFYHDVGMVFREDERNRLTEEPEWKTFLDTKPDAFLAVKKAGGVPLDIAEWYCRWRHAERVWVYLPNDLRWGQTSIREELGELCRSHNLPAADLLKLRIDFRGEADLRFCAVLLRLADILDFDRTRSPEAVYEHLGLSRRIDPRQDASDVEWRKHLCSEGFRFPQKRSDAYQLGFIAGPDEPGVEHDVREFLRVIEEEMEQCRVVLATCSERWRTVPLPVSTDRSNICGNGYRYGEYRFSLDQGQVMGLLMGENLYEDPYVFVRELIQNALDASRHRRFVERAYGDPGFAPKAIQVGHWIDRDGYQWVRFDDDGMGMDEEIVRNHLLKVGSSYYNTASFRAEILRLREKTHEDFVPISRFGIGLLSCFIAGDRVEISTLRRAPAGGTGEPIRLSLNGLHGFFTLQTPHMPAQPMPLPDAEDPGYRTEPGTSIAVRLDPTKEIGIFDPQALLKRYVACPPVSVEFAGERIGGDPALLVDRPWCERTTITDQYLGQVEFLPIDLTRHSPTSELKGQLVLVKPSSDWSGNAWLVTEDFRHIFLRNLFNDRLSTPVELPECLHEIVRLLGTRELAWLSHNGCAVPTQQSDLFLSDQDQGDDGLWIRGVIALSDSLRPSLAVSRDKLLSLPWRLYSAAGVALYEALRELGEDLRSHRRELFSQFLPQPGILLRDLLEDEHLRVNGPWWHLPILVTQGELRSAQEIRELIGRERIELFNLPFQSEESFLSWCAGTLVQIGLNVSVHLEMAPGSERYTIKREVARVLVEEGDPNPITEGHKLFVPLTFLPFAGSKRLRSISVPIINVNHPFAAWLLDRAPEIARRYPGLFKRIRSELRATWQTTPPKQLNVLLDRLRELHPSVRPPKNLVLTNEDFFEADPP